MDRAEEKKITLYRKLGGSDEAVKAIEFSGMQSAYIRHGGKLKDLMGSLLRQSVNLYSLQHITNGHLENSPMISTTTYDDSSLAYGIARAYSNNKEDPIHTYSVTVPVYNVIVASKRSNEIKNFELLIFGGVVRDDTKHMYQEPSDLPLSSADYADDMRRKKSVPDILIEPPDQ